MAFTVILAGLLLQVGLAKKTGAGPTPPTGAPSLQFNLASNSQYLGIV